MLKNKFHQAKSKKNALFFLAFCITCMIVAISIPVFAKEEPVKSITIESENLNYEKNESGSYKITKQAEWIGKGKARITFQVDTKELIKENTNTDTILIIDTSGSMTGDKLDKVKSDSVDLIQKTLQDNNNKIGIIEFNDNASIISNLSNDIPDLTNKINNLTTLGSTNYYQALVKLDELLKTYQKEENRELTVLFLTDGLPNINTPNEIGQYKYLKSEYPYLNINGIQYEMGSNILTEIKNISDKQFIADMNTLNNVLIDASSPRETYNNFKITDYINTEHFKIEDKKAITATTGNFTLDKGNGKVTWNLDGLSSGTSATMTIEIYLKDEYINNPDLYKTNIKEEVTSEINGIKENINAPDGCKVEGTLPESKQYSVFNPVEIEDTTLTCDGYKFQGWEVVNKENVSMIGNDYFVSDGNDIKLKAIWSKVSLKKSMNGTIYDVKSVIKKVYADPDKWEFYQGEFWNDKYRYNTTKIVIQNKLNPIENAEEFWDISELGDKSVMAYAVLNEDGSTYTIYLQGNEKISANEDSTGLFAGFEMVESIDGLEYLDTSKVKKMRAMFMYCESLLNLDLSNFDTSSATDISFIFSWCGSISKLDLSSFDTLNVTDMSSMFYWCESLTDINMSNLDTSKVTNMESMFSGCKIITNLDLSNFDTSNVTDMSWMFNNCRKIERVNLKSFDTSSVTDMSYMFSLCEKIENVDLSGFNTSNVTDMNSMFSGCSKLKTLNLSSFNISNVTNMGDMFSRCLNLREIDFRNAEFNNNIFEFGMFNNTSNLSVIVKDETARSWIQDKLGSNGTAIIAS